MYSRTVPYSLFPIPYSLVPYLSLIPFSRSVLPSAFRIRSRQNGISLTGFASAIRVPISMPPFSSHPALQIRNRKPSGLRLWGFS